MQETFKSWAGEKTTKEIASDRCFGECQGPQQPCLRWAKLLEAILGDIAIISHPYSYMEEKIFGLEVES